MYGLGSKMLNAVTNMYDGSMACVRVNGGLSEWFVISIGVIQGCIMSLWLFNVHMDGSMRDQSKNPFIKGL